MGVTVAVTRVACNLGIGDQDITTADLGGLTPKAVLFIVSQAVTDGVVAANAVIGIGAATSSTQRWAFSQSSEDAQATTDTYRRGATDECVLKILTSSANIDGEADFKEFIQNGCTITWADAPASAFLLTAVFFAGTDLLAKADVKTLHANQDGTLDINDVGFEPDVVLTGCIGTAIDDATHNNWIFSHGVAINKTPVGQYCFCHSDLDGQPDSELTAEITDDYGIMQVYDGALTWGGEFSDFDAGGFSVTQRVAGAGGDDLCFLALAFGNAVDFWAGIIDTPIGAGNQSQVGPGFTPQYVHCGVTQMPAIDTLYIDANAGSIGISTFDADDEYCNSVQSEDAQAASDTQSLSDDIAINLPDDDGTAAHVAAFVSFDANGWTWNFTATEDPAVKYWALAIEELAAPPVGPFLTTYAGYSVPVG